MIKINSKYWSNIRSKLIGDIEQISDIDQILDIDVFTINYLLLRSDLVHNKYHIPSNSLLIPYMYFFINKRTQTTNLHTVWLS